MSKFNVRGSSFISGTCSSLNHLLAKDLCEVWLWIFSTPVFMQSCLVVDLATVYSLVYGITQVCHTHLPPPPLPLSPPPLPSSSGPFMHMYMYNPPSPHTHTHTHTQNVLVHKWNWSRPVQCGWFRTRLKVTHTYLSVISKLWLLGTN